MADSKKRKERLGDDRDRADNRNFKKSKVCLRNPAHFPPTSNFVLARLERQREGKAIFFFKLDIILFS